MIAIVVADGAILFTSFWTRASSSRSVVTRIRVETLKSLTLIRMPPVVRSWFRKVQPPGENWRACDVSGALT